MHKIIGVEKNSIAHELEIMPNDILLTINGKKIADVLDYRFMTLEEELTLEIKKPNGEIWEIEIEKDAEENLGLEFESYLMDHMKNCQNHCIFCFMDQLPQGMREALYFKDDDPRMSFLSGNYVTLTNLSPAEAERIASYHLSPINISVHAIDISIRRKMLNNQSAGNLLQYLILFNKAGITMNYQIVLCKGINDGTALDDTIEALLTLGAAGSSLSVVPVGLTKYRHNLFPLEPFSQEDALTVIRQVEKWQLKAIKKYDTSFVFCSDEWYILAGLPVPPYDHYENFPQLENGVGMYALFEHNLTSKIFNGTFFKKIADFDLEPNNLGIVTGTAAYDLIKKNTQLRVYPVHNDFFGHTITVSGLLTGRDIIAQVKKKAINDRCSGLILPPNMFRVGTELTLDDMTRKKMEDMLGLPVFIGNDMI